MRLGLFVKSLEDWTSGLARNPDAALPDSLRVLFRWRSPFS